MNGAHLCEPLRVKFREANHSRFQLGRLNPTNLNQGLGVFPYLFWVHYYRGRGSFDQVAGATKPVIRKQFPKYCCERIVARVGPLNDEKVGLHWGILW